MKTDKNKTDGKVSLWTPLVGFDMNRSDCGAQEYLDKIPFKPLSIKLFAFNADIVTLHGGMKKEEVFPGDYCNYYGAVRNEIRSIQPWTNFRLKTLADHLKSAGVETYLSVMGLHTVPDDEGGEAGLFGFIPKQRFLTEHPELVMQGIRWSGNLCAIKRFKDGSYFEDYFAHRAAETLTAYNISGIHLCDCFFPPCIQAQNGDFSDDLTEQFTTRTGMILPPDLSAPLTKPFQAGMKKRAAYIWANLREEWIMFLANRWQEFFTKLCDALHKIGKKVSVMSVWTGEPFEALYRFGIDYKKLEKAGLDEICVEDQAAVLYAGDRAFDRIKTHEFMNMPMIMKAYSPSVRHMCLNFVKDSTEENSMINHLPCAFEKEAFSLASKMYYGKTFQGRAADGFFVCLADSLTGREWELLGTVYGRIFEDEPIASLSPVLVWSDRMMSSFLKEYLKTRRFSTHRMVAELSKRGGNLGGAVRIKNVGKVKGCLFVPNIDLLDESELKILEKYTSGPIFYTCLKSSKFTPFCVPDYYFEEENSNDNEHCQCAGVLQSDNAAFGAMPDAGGDGGYGVHIDGDPMRLADTEVWMEDILFRRVSGGFLTKCAYVLKILGCAAFDWDFPAHLTTFGLKNNKIRVLAENDNLNRYQEYRISVNFTMRDLENKCDFPIQPLKLIGQDQRAAANMGTVEEYRQASGFVVKMPPHGVAVVDVLPDFADKKP